MSEAITAPCRLFGIPARDAARIALLRRGPSKWTRLILWRVDEDRFEDGQWFYGRIYEHRSALSPDGQLFVYFAQKLRSPARTDPTYTYAWTAVSRPPYLTALALWPKGDCWNGGGLFADNHTLRLNHGHAQAHPKHPTTGLRVLGGKANPWFRQGEDEQIYSAIRESIGWRMVQAGQIDDKREQLMAALQGEDVGPDGKRRRLIVQMTTPTIYERPHPSGHWTLRWTYYGVDYNQFGDSDVLDHSLREERTGAKTLLPSDTTWADWDQRGRLALTRAGALYAIAPGDVAQLASVEPLRDFNDQRHAPLKPPQWALRWPDQAAPRHAGG